MSHCSWERDRTSCVFFNDTATTEIYTLSLHDALPICALVVATSSDQVDGLCRELRGDYGVEARGLLAEELVADRKSTRLNSSHANISYAVFCLKKKQDRPPLARKSLVPTCRLKAQCQH